MTPDALAVIGAVLATGLLSFLAGVFCGARASARDVGRRLDALHTDFYCAQTTLDRLLAMAADDRAVQQLTDQLRHDAAGLAGEVHAHPIQE